MDISSVILAGGRSARMGSDKALLRASPNGPTMIECVVSRLTEAGLPPALIISEKADSYARLKIPIVSDELRGAGALGGIYTALVRSGARRTLVVACDMPLLSSALLRHMASLPLSGGALVPCWRTMEGLVQLEPLHAIYTSDCIEPLRRRLERRQLKVTDALKDLQISYLEETDLRRFDPHLESFRNVNTPEDWQALLNAGHR